MNLYLNEQIVFFFFLFWFRQIQCEHKQFIEPKWIQSETQRQRRSEHSQMQYGLMCLSNWFGRNETVVCVVISNMNEEKHIVWYIAGFYVAAKLEREKKATENCRQIKNTAVEKVTQNTFNRISLHEKRIGFGCCNFILLQRFRWNPIHFTNRLIKILLNTFSTKFVARSRSNVCDCTHYSHACFFLKKPFCTMSTMYSMRK